MEIIKYQEKYKRQITNLILNIQNNEAKINLSIDEQPDLLDIEKYYLNNGGFFLLAVENGDVTGTIALMNKGNGNGVLKKFFVREDRRSQKVGVALYKTLYEFAAENNFKNILLDTPSVATASHRFYERSGFEKTDKSQIPFEYDYPDRDSYLYLLKL